MTQERNEYYDQILLEDLSASLPDSRIRLEIADRAATSSSAAALPSSRTGDGLDIDELEEGQLVRGTKEMMSLWELHLGEVRFSSIPGVVLIRYSVRRGSRRGKKHDGRLST